MRWIRLFGSWVWTTMWLLYYGLYGAVGGAARGVAEEWPAARSLYAQAKRDFHSAKGAP